MYTKLEDFKIISEDIQVSVGIELEYEMYGSTEGGMILERVGDKILYHAYHGVKLDMGDWDTFEGSFFRHGSDNFFKHYRNCDDYDYTRVPEMTIKEIINTIRGYVYMHHPNLSTRTCMGYKNTGVLSDPNHCRSKVVLNNGKSYCISKQYDTVNISYNSKQIAEFKLDEGMFDKALDLHHKKRLIMGGISGKIDDSVFEEYLILKSHLEEFIKLQEEI